MMILSTQRQDIASLIGGAGPERGERFDPVDIKHLAIGDEITPISLRRTASFPAIQGIGNYTVAIFSFSAPGIEPISPETTEDIIHRECDGAILLGQKTMQLLELAPATSEGAQRDTLVPSGDLVEASRIAA